MTANDNLYDDPPLTLRQLLHALTEDYTLLDEPVHVDAYDSTGELLDCLVTGLSDRWVIASRGMDQPLCDVDGEHIARHDPARVLRGVEAKRKLLNDLWFAGDVAEVLDWEGNLIAGANDALNGLLRTLAAEWSTHPGYRQEWSP